MDGRSKRDNPEHQLQQEIVRIERGDVADNEAADDKKDIDSKGAFADKGNMHQYHAGRGNGAEGLNGLQFGAYSPDGNRSHTRQSSFAGANP